MQVVLLERVEKLGQMGALVTVKSGYARNYLIPKGRALRATPANVAFFEERRAQFEAENLQKRGSAGEVASKLEGATVLLIRSASENGHLYGGVSAKDVAEALSAGYCPVDRQKVVIEHPIKEVGVHAVNVRLHPEVSVSVNLCIARTQEEAEKLRDGLRVKAEPAVAPAEAEASA